LSNYFDLLFSVVFGVTLRLLVTNTSSSSPVNNKRRRVPAMRVSNLPQSGACSCMYNTRRLHRWQHVMKPDIGGESRFLPIPPAFDAQLKGLCRNIAITFVVEKSRWCGYPTAVKQFWRYVYSFRQNTRTWRTDGRTADWHRATA